MGPPVINPGYIIYNENINNENPCYCQHLPGTDYLKEQFSDFFTEHIFLLSGTEYTGFMKQSSACIAPLTILVYYRGNE